jgi:hypothetical protein
MTLGVCKLKEEALDPTLWRSRFERGYAMNDAYLDGLQRIKGNLCQIA